MRIKSIANPVMQAIKQLEQFLQLALQQPQVWLFAYGSLMWKRDFDAQAQLATLSGWQRKFCIASTVYRGSPEHPGLVLGLDTGTACTGQALQLSADNIDKSLECIWRREMVNGVYRPLLLPVYLQRDQRQQDCWCFVSDAEHAQYRQHMTVDQVVSTIMSSTGRAGSNRDYLHQTYQHLQNLGVEDEYLAEFCKLC